MAIINISNNFTLKLVLHFFYNSCSNPATIATVAMNQRMKTGFFVNELLWKRRYSHTTLAPLRE